MTRWIDPSPVKIPGSFKPLNLTEFIAETLVRRGISTPDAARAFLDPESQTPVSPYELPGMDAAVERILMAIRRKERICVWGDFDVDGQTSTALLVQTLRAFGADVSWHIPIRARSSHGVHIPQLTELIDRGAKLVLTCDTGITAHQAVEYAATRNVSFVITDHHDPGGSLPAAEAVVNPKLLPSYHTLASLAGVGVAYKLAEAILDNEQYSIIDPDAADALLALDDLLDLVALGLVADMALLNGETRTLVQKGLRVLQGTKRLGLQVMAEMSGTDLRISNEETIGFTFAPRLNALGRLGDANPAVELLITNDPSRARVLATQLEGLNSQRRLLTNQVYQAAREQLRENPALLDPPVLVLGHASWPGGVIGIVASRLVERFHKPVILFSTPPDEPARGSARSVEGIHITQGIAAQSELLLNYGGHPMAAGLSLELENLPAFCKGLSQTIEKMQGDAAREEPSLQIDAWISLDSLSFDLADTVEQLAPFGAGNPPLTFASQNVLLKSISNIGKTKEHLRLNLEDMQGNNAGVLWWNGTESDLPEPGTRMDIAYSLRSSTFRNERQLALQFIDYRIVEEKPSEVKIKPSIEVIDLRTSAQKLPELMAIEQGSLSLLFREGNDAQVLNGTDRYHLHPADTLVIYTCPPGPQEFQTLMEQVKPQKVYLVAENPPAETAKEFLTRLAGMAKYAIVTNGGQTTLEELVVGSAQREITVRIGLQWLAAAGHIVVIENGRFLSLSTGDQQADGYLKSEMYTAVKGLFEETAAYQKYVAGIQDPTLLFR
jgi:single-stranded-DNA-specific exonuclease